MASKVKEVAVARAHNEALAQPTHLVSRPGVDRRPAPFAVALVEQCTPFAGIQSHGIQSDRITLRLFIAHSPFTPTPHVAPP